MTNTIFLLDFNRGTVEEIDADTLPRAGRTIGSAPPEIPAAGDGYVLASLGTPPPDEDRDVEG
jgi:hypothetical protein